MSTLVLPSLVGLGFDVVRTPVWDTTVQQSITGMETRIARQTYPRWKWELTYSVLRSASAYGELQTLAGFFNARQGMFDTFLYQDADDYSVTTQQINTGDGITRTFQLLRAFGGFLEPVFAPNVVSAVYLGGMLQSSSNYTITQWGSSVPGSITFNTAPTSGAIITATFSYYFPVRMNNDSIDFTLFLSGYYKTKKVSFISVKN